MLLGANKRIPIAMRSFVTTALLFGMVLVVRAEKVFPVSSFQPVNTNANVVAVEEESSSSSTDGVLVTGRSREREKKARNERDELLLHNTLAAFAGSAYVHNSNNNQVAARVDKVGDKGDNSFDLETDSSSSTSLDLEEENTVGAASTIEIDAKDESSASSSLDLDETGSNASNSSTLVDDYDDDDEGDTTDDDDEEALLLQNLTTTTTSVPLDYTTSDVVLVSSSNRATITGGSEENNSTEDCRTITDLICSNEEFSILCKILAETGYDTIFNYHDTSVVTSTNSTDEDEDELEELYTVFAPNDEAFKALPRKYAEQLLSSTENMEWLVLYHSIGVNTVAGAVISSDDLDCGELVRMSNGKNTRTVCESGEDGAVYQKGAGNSIADDPKNNTRQGEETAALALFPEIIEFDIEACNGLVHVVNNIILPKKLPQQ
jgi:uncharacterized surface protein with fasciclin (FAS1) repeats